MTARKKKSTRKKSARRKTAKKTPAKDLLHAADRELSRVSKRLEKQMAGVGRELQKAERQAGREAARLLRQARAKLDKMHVSGSSEWNKFLRQSKRDLSSTLGKLERSVRPKPAPRKKATRKRATRKKA